jgi:hypothetical protein
MNIPQPDRIALIKSNGMKIPEIAAFVQSEIIFINDASLPIEEGDEIERILPNGLIEIYVVKDRGYFAKPSPHYQVKAIKKTSLSVERVAPSTIIHQHGENPRVNINSTDLSSNIINKVDLNTFEEIKQVLTDQISDNEKRTVYLQSLEELKESVGKKSYIDKYKQFIEITANHMGLISPFIPYLTSMIH